MRSAVPPRLRRHLVQFSVISQEVMLSICNKKVSFSLFSSSPVSLRTHVCVRAIVVFFFVVVVVCCNQLHL